MTSRAIRRQGWQQRSFSGEIVAIRATRNHGFLEYTIRDTYGNLTDFVDEYHEMAKFSVSDLVVKDAGQMAVSERKANGKGGMERGAGDKKEMDW